MSKKATSTVLGAGLVIAVVALVTFVLFSTIGSDPVEPAKPSVGKVSKREKQKPARLISRGEESSVARDRMKRAYAMVTNVNGRAALRVGAVKVGGDAEADYVDGDNRPWPEKDKRIARALDKALDADDFDALREALPLAAKCDNAQIRDRAVDALSMFGPAAVPELLSFMTDPDEDVAESARMGFQSALSEIEDDDEKASVIDVIMRSTTNSEVLEDVSDELCSLDDLMAIQIIADTVEANPESPAAKAAMQAYSDITDEQWGGFDAAESWLQENYADHDDETGAGQEAAGTDESAAEGAATEGTAKEGAATEGTAEEDGNEDY